MSLNVGAKLKSLDVSFSLNNVSLTFLEISSEVNNFAAHSRNE